MSSHTQSSSLSKASHSSDRRYAVKPASDTVLRHNLYKTMCGCQSAFHATHPCTRMYKTDEYLVKLYLQPNLKCNPFAHDTSLILWRGSRRLSLWFSISLYSCHVSG